MKFFRQEQDLSVHGFVVAGFEPMVYQFQEILKDSKELGGACCVFRKGEKVVDIWGGWRDLRRTQPWEQDTLSLSFSGSKGMMATAVAVAHSRGLLSYDERVCTYWPEFAQHGKQDITVAQLLNHQAGLTGLDHRLSQLVHSLSTNPSSAQEILAKALASQIPTWEPGTFHGHHVGLELYVSELIRRVDHRHRNLSQFFRDEVARPMKAQFYFGLPHNVSSHRMAQMKLPSQAASGSSLSLLSSSSSSSSSSSFGLPSSRSSRGPSKSSLTPCSKKWLQAEVDSGAGIGQARALAKIYGELATGGRRLGLGSDTLKLLLSEPEGPTGGCRDAVLGCETHYQLGFQKPGMEGRADLGRRCFGSPASGGASAYADPDALLGYSFTMNRMRSCMDKDPRDIKMRNTLYQCIQNLHSV